MPRGGKVYVLLVGKGRELDFGRRHALGGGPTRIEPPTSELKVARFSE